MDKSLMERRKEREIDFHNQRERDRQSLDQASFQKKYPNLKAYSIVRKSRGHLADWIRRNCQGKVALDYCCGTGGISLVLARNGAYVHGIDLSDESIKTAENLLADEGYGASSEFQVMDAEKLLFDEDTFDVIVCSGVLHHLNLAHAYRQLARVLKPNGKILCVEALGHNPLINLYRWLTPHLRTEWEVKHILKKRDIRLAELYFGKIEIDFFHLFSIVGIPFHDTSTFDTLLTTLEWIDSVALKVPLFQWMAWQIIFELSLPKK